MKQLIINADDFGINEAITAEIERLIEQQAVSSTTVMANLGCSLYAFRIFFSKLSK